MEYNNRIVVNFTDREGKQDSDVYGIRKLACDYARLLSEMGYHISSVRDEYEQEDLDWKKPPSVASDSLVND